MTGQAASTWPVVRLLDVCDAVTVAVRSNQRLPPDTWFLSDRSIAPDGVRAASLVRVGQDRRYVATRQFWFRRGDVVLDLRTGHVWVADRDGVTVVSNVVLRPNQFITAGFLAYTLFYLGSENMSRLISRPSKKAAHELAASFVNRMPTIAIGLTLIREQEELVALLDDAGDLIHLGERQLAKLGQLPSAVFTERLRPLLRYADWDSLRRFADVSEGIQDPEGGDTGVSARLVRPGHMEGGRVDVTSPSPGRVLPRQLPYRGLQHDDVIMVIAAQTRERVGAAALWPGAAEPGVLHPDLARIRPVSSRMSGAYLTAMLQTPEVQQQIRSALTSEGDRYTLRLDAVRALQIPMISPAEQLAYEETVMDCALAAKAMTQRRDRAALLFRHTLRMAMAGQLSTQGSGEQHQTWLLPHRRDTPQWRKLPNDRPIVERLKPSQTQVWEVALNMPRAFALRELQAAYQQHCQSTGSKAPWPTSDEALRRTLDFLVNMGALVAEQVQGSILRWRRPEPDSDYMEV